MIEANDLSDLYRALENFRDSYHFLRTNRSYVGSIKSAFAAIVSLLLNVADQQQPPYNLERIGGFLRVHTVEETAMALHGELIPDNQGFTLRLSRSDAGASRRTTFAHELGHTLFYDLRESPPSRASKDPAIDISQDKEEWLCFDFARELLMPTNAALAALQANKNSQSLDALWSFCYRFDVSLTLACRRIFRDLKAWSTSVVFIAQWNDVSRSWKPIEIFKGKEMKSIRIQTTLLRNILPNSSVIDGKVSRVVLISGKTFATEIRSFGPSRLVCMLKKRTTA